MKEITDPCFVKNLKSEGFVHEFEAKTDADGGFECNIFSNGEYVVIITGESVRSKTNDGKAEMAYKHYYCRLGNDDYLKRFLEYEVLMRNPGLLTQEYRGLFIRLMNKVESYGTKNFGPLAGPPDSDVSMGYCGVRHQFIKAENIHTLYQYLSMN